MLISLKKNVNLSTFWHIKKHYIDTELIQNDVKFSYMYYNKTKGKKWMIQSLKYIFDFVTNRENITKVLNFKREKK